MDPWPQKVSMAPLGPESFWGSQIGFRFLNEVKKIGQSGRRANPRMEDPPIEREEAFIFQ